MVRQTLKYLKRPRIRNEDKYIGQVALQETREVGTQCSTIQKKVETQQPWQFKVNFDKANRKERDRSMEERYYANVRDGDRWRKQLLCG